MTPSARHYARLGAVQYLYSWSVQNESINRADDQLLIDSNVLLHGDLAYFQKLMRSIPPRIEQIDALLAQAIHRKIDTIDPVELAILRLGVYEMIAEFEVPLKVITNECIELSREFGNVSSYKFINGTLDKLAFSDNIKPGILSSNAQSQHPGHEFDLIERYFANRQGNHSSVVAGIGDDCAIVNVPADQQLLVTTDTLIENVHFAATTNARHIGHKSLAVSLSDLAAKGARPHYALLNLSMPQYDKAWLAEFSRGFFDMSTRHGVALIGGDTARGPLAISITAFGLAKAGESPLRSGAQAGDVIYVTGTLGDAALGLAESRLGLKLEDGEIEYLQQRLERPEPRVKAGQVLAPYATASIDISDGLIADLGHILHASQVSATIELDNIPMSPVYRKLLPDIGWDFALAYGDDYELCFTAHEDLPASVIDEAGIAITKIGQVGDGEGLQLRQSDGSSYEPRQAGYVHF